MKPFRLLFAATLFSIMLQPVRAMEPEPTPDPRVGPLVLKLFEVLNYERTFQESYENAVNYERQLIPNIPKVFWDNLRRQYRWEQVRDRIAPSYAERYTYEELQHLISFFKSPTGQKWTDQKDEIGKVNSYALSAYFKETIAATVEKVRGDALLTDEQAERLLGIRH